MRDDLQLELDHLAKAELHIVEGEGRVSEQLMRLDALRQDSSSVAVAEKLLATLEGILAEWRVHREQIFRRIWSLKGKDDGSES